MSVCELHFSHNLDDIIRQVKSVLILQPYQGYPTLEQVAILLNLSSRTLKRRLHSMNSRFLYLLDEVKQQDSKKLLLTTTLEIQQISNTLGYENPTNFIRAFKKWTGMTPQEFRLVKA